MTVVRRRIKESQRQEKRGALQNGGWVQPGSGSQVARKGDVRTPRVAGATRTTSGRLIEYKRTEGKSIRLTTVMLDKIRREALLEGKEPRLGFELGGRDWVVLSAEDYLDLEERAGAGPGQ